MTQLLHSVLLHFRWDHTWVAGLSLWGIDTSTSEKLGLSLLRLEVRTQTFESPKNAYWEWDSFKPKRKAF